MLNRRPIILLALFVVLGAFGLGVMRLFSLRFAAGDVYPEYSSLRGDPLGCRVYFESLDQLGEARTRRFLQPLNKLPEGRGATLFVFGLPWSELTAEPDEYKALQGFLGSGGRIVVTLYPELGRPRDFTTGLATNRAGLRRPPRTREELRALPVSLREKHGFQVGGVAMPPGKINPPHMHFTAEVFICTRSEWDVHWGFNPEPLKARIGPGDIASMHLDLPWLPECR